MRIKLTVSTIILFLTAISGSSFAADAPSPLDEGRSLAFDRNKGNCLACHAIPGDSKATSPGNIGPALVSMKSRFPSRAKMRAQIWDATERNYNTSMPPYGKNKILTEAEIDLVTDYILSM